MALRTPPSWLQYGSHTAENDRLTAQALYSSTGVIANSMAVTAQASPNMTVNVASGWCAVVNTYSSTGGVYVGYNDATYVATISTADTVNPRIDLIVATVNDQGYSGTTNNIVFQVVTGVPAASPVVPSTPSNSVALAQVAVAANATTVTTANIIDVRVPAISNIVQNPIQSVRLTANGSAIGVNGLPFGANKGAFLIAGHNYLIDIILPFTKTTAGTVTWRINSTTNAISALSFSDSLNQSLSVVAASPTSFPVSASYANGATYVTRFYGTITANSNCRVFLDITAISAGTVTPLTGSQFTVTDLGTAATIGNIG